MLRSCKKPLTDKLMLISAKRFQQLWQIPCSEIIIHIFNVALQVGLIAFAQATGHDELFNLTFFLCAGIFKYGINAFFLCIINKPTRIYNNDRSIVIRRFMGHIKLIGTKLTHQHLAVVDILRTAKGNNVNLVLFEGFSTHFEGAKVMFAEKGVTKQNEDLQLLHSRK